MSSNQNLPSWLQGADLLDEPPPAQPKRPPLEMHTSFVVRQLGKNTPPSDIIMTLVQKHNCNWDDAERFVSSVAINHHDHIKGQQRPLIIVITLGTLIGGLLLFGYGLLSVSDGYVNRGTAYLFGTGFFMIVGGLYGVFQLLRDMARG